MPIQNNSVICADDLLSYFSLTEATTTVYLLPVVQWNTNILIPNDKTPNVDNSQGTCNLMVQEKTIGGKHLANGQTHLQHSAE